MKMTMMVMNIMVMMVMAMVVMIVLCDPGGKMIVSSNLLFFFGFSDLVLWTFRSFFFRFSTCSSLDFLFFEEVITYQVISMGHTV